MCFLKERGVKMMIQKIPVQSIVVLFAIKGLQNYYLTTSGFGVASMIVGSHFCPNQSAGQPNVKYEYRDVIRKLFGVEKFAVFSLVVLELVDPSIEARYTCEQNVEYHTEMIS